jgi:hypothetical protein
MAYCGDTLFESVTVYLKMIIFLCLVDFQAASSYFRKTAVLENFLLNSRVAFFRSNPEMAFYDAGGFFFFHGAVLN